MPSKGLLCLLICAFASITPQAAVADWYDNDKALPSGTNPSIGLTGTFAFTSSNGGTHCPAVTTTLQMTGGSADGHLTSFAVEGELAKCEVSGGLVFLAGGTTSLKGIELTGSPTAVNTEEKEILISGLALHYTYNNGLKITLSSKAGNPLVATPDDPADMSKLTLSGTLGSGLGDVTMNGPLSILGADAQTYGLQAGL